ncbi:MAG: 3-oxoacyl-[acyl-carrier-protein] reductase [Planctomycetes bacterium]|jgi:3-oxoacyl-[acyl-carrier protein] reductase|nr:3-oxoacyl-[acyl-carrier-protein] reductase [Planctomycetota bacterium]
MLLEGLSAVVTGGGGGIGAAVCASFAREGAAVTVNDVNPEAAERVAAACRGAGAKAFADTHNITDPDQVALLLEEAAARSGGVHVLVNNAGITRDTLLVRMSDEDWNRVLSVNLTGAFHCCRSAAKLMMKQRAGSIVNVASVVGIGGNAGQANYAASKGGLIALTLSLAKEMGPRGVRVNAVAPGFVRTPMTDVLPEDVKKGILDRTPLRRFGTPEDVADAVLFLAGPRSSFVSGAVLRIDGGLSM